MQHRGLALRYIAMATLFELLIHIIPIITGIGISFYNINQYTLSDWFHAPFVGWKNYVLGVSPSSPIGRSFLSTIGITVLYTVLVVVLSTIIGMVAALIMNREFPGRGLLRTLFLLPYVMPVFVVGVLWRFILLNDGPLNTILVDTLHILDQRPYWLVGPNAFWAVVIVGIWRTWPFCYLMLMAGLQTIPQDIYESAALDGAGRWIQFTRLTLPLLRPVLSVMVLVVTLWTFNDFTTAFTLLGSQPPASADLMAVHIYNNAFRNWQFGMGAAMSVIMLVIMLAFTLLYNRVLRVGRETA